jgi:putative endonuclease
MKMGIYILLCNNGRYYIGSTNDFERRIAEHRRGSVKATRYLLPVKVVFIQKCHTLIEARRLEYKLKNKKSRTIIDKIVKDGYIKFSGPIV